MSKFLDSNGLTTLWAQAKAKFALISHTHTVSQISDYVVDSALSDTSTNPVQNKAVMQSLSSKAPRPTQTAVTLAAASWVGTAAPYTYTISSVTCTATQIVSVYAAMGLTTEQVKAMAKVMITASSQSANSIVLEAQSLPTIDLPVIVEVGGEPA